MKVGNLEVYGIIYKITNKVNGKCYIGQTIHGFDKRYGRKGKDIERVYNYYDYMDKSGNFKNNYLFNSIKKHGFENFNVNKVFDIAFSKEELDIKEKLWIKYYDCINNGYNNNEGGANGKASKETKKKSSIVRIGFD